MKQFFLYSSLFFLLAITRSLFSMEKSAEIGAPAERQRSASASDAEQAAVLQQLKDSAKIAEKTKDINAVFKSILMQDQKEWNSIFSYAIDPKEKLARKKLKILATLLLPKVNEIVDGTIIDKFVMQFKGVFEPNPDKYKEISIVLEALENQNIILSWNKDVEKVLSGEPKEWRSIFSGAFNGYPLTLKTAALKILAQALLPKIQNFTDIISLQLFIEKYVEALEPKSSSNKEQVTYKALEALKKKEDEFKKRRSNELSGSLGRKLGSALHEAAQEEQKAEPSAPPTTPSQDSEETRLKGEIERQAEEARLKVEAEQNAKEAEQKAKADHKVTEAEEARLKAEAEQKANLEAERQAKEAEETKLPPVDAQPSNLKPRAQSAPPPVPVHDADYEALAAKLTRTPNPPVRSISLKQIGHSAPPSQDPAGLSIGLKSPAKPAAPGELDTPDQSPVRQSADFKAELEQKAKLEADRKAAEEARIKAVAEQKAKREVGRKAKEAEGARSKTENERKAKAEEEARLAAIKAKQEEERMAQEAKAAEEARIKDENERKANAEEEARLAAIKAKREEERMAQEAKNAEEASSKAENERKANAEEEARLAAIKAKQEEERMAQEAKNTEETRSQGSGPQPASIKAQAKLAAFPFKMVQKRNPKMPFLKAKEHLKLTRSQFNVLKQPFPPSQPRPQTKQPL